jgi:hypothetical protein
MAATSFTAVRVAARWLLVMLLVMLSGCATAGPPGEVAAFDTTPANSVPHVLAAVPAVTPQTGEEPATSTTGYLAFGDETATPGRLSAEGPWRLVPSAPGIDAEGLTYRLGPGLWVFLPLVEDHRHGVVWVFRQADSAIIEAYLRAWVTYVDHASRTPMVLDPSRWLPTITDGGASFGQVLQRAHRAGGHLEVGAGIVLRPEVIDDHRSAATARVLDCVLDGSYFVDRSGALVAGSTRDVVRSGWAMDLELTDTGWKGVRVGGAVEAC